MSAKNIIWKQDENDPKRLVPINKGITYKPNGLRECKRRLRQMKKQEQKVWMMYRS
jgi:hypothetical protein